MVDIQNPGESTPDPGAGAPPPIPQEPQVQSAEPTTTQVSAQAEAGPLGVPAQQIATPAVKSPDERKAALAQSIAREVANGGRVESQSDYQAIVVKGKKVNHLLHFFIGIFTLGGWWLFAWLPLVIFGGEKREIVQVDDYGNTLLQKT